MRLRTTAAAFAGAFALVLPVSGQAFADGGGTLNYTFLDDGRERRAQLRPAAVGTCYLLNGTSPRRPAVEAFNKTDLAALLFDNDACAGDPVAVAEPRSGAEGFEAVAVRFEPVRDKPRPPRDREDEAVDEVDEVDEVDDGREHGGHERDDSGPADAGQGGGDHREPGNGHGDAEDADDDGDVDDAGHADDAEDADYAGDTEAPDWDGAGDAEEDEEDYADEEKRTGTRTASASRNPADVFDVIFRNVP
ncbi:hypothetical protein [Streptomyces sp. NPDC012888]|uniref:hypothetical protein n=1 Tax=Streptomyces sp. NPDC012888 TaxID=3364855 RepID=UPI0036AAA6C7